MATFTDVQILYNLKTRIAPFLGIQPEDMFNEDVIIKRSGTTSLSFDYVFSTKYLLEKNCNVSSIINLKSKLDSSGAEQSLKQLILPQFSVVAMSVEGYQRRCSTYSSDAPVIGTSFGTMTINLGQYFSFQVSQSLFTSPTGTDMKLKIYLRFINNTATPTNYWIGLSGTDLDQNIQIRGLPGLNTYSKQSSYNFRLVAVTPILIESSQNFVLSIEKSFTNVLITYTLTQNSLLTTSTATFARLFSAFVSSYLGVNSSTIVILDIQVGSSFSVVWTLSSLSQEPCKFAEIKNVNEKIFASDGSVSPSLRNGLYGAASFSPSSVSINLFGSCNPPKVNKTIPQLFVPKYGSLVYFVPNDAFSIANSADTLKLSLLDSAGNALSVDSWIWYNNNTRLISGTPTSVSQKQQYSYILRAENVYGSFVDQNISVILNWTAPAFTLKYRITFTYLLSTMPYANLLSFFLQKLKTYFAQPSEQNIVLSQVAFLSNAKVILIYQNTSLRTDVCDVIGNNAIMEKLQASIIDKTPNSELVAAMNPEFSVTGVEVFLYGKCQILQRKPPYFNFLNPIAYDFGASIKTVSYCSASSYLVPEVMFHDEEEGGTRNLKLDLLNLSKEALPLNNWVNINSTSQTIYAVADDEPFSEITEAYQMFRLFAYDSDGKYDNVRLKFNVSGPPPPGHYNVTMQLRVSGISQQPYVLQLAHLFGFFKLLFPNGPAIHVRSYKFEDPAHPSITTFVWSPCGMERKFCNLSIIDLVRSRIFAPGTRSMNTNLNSIFQGTFTVLSVFESAADSCQQSPPVLSASLPTLYIGFCGQLTYRIPSNTFTDKQDGNTLNLKLRLLNADATVIPEGNWLHFDQAKQEVKAVLTEDQTKSSFPRKHVFFLVATDSNGNSANTTLSVNINGSQSPYSHSFTIQTKYTSTSVNGLLYKFSKRVQEFFGDTIPTFQALRMTEAIGQKIIVTWSNCSLRYDPCDVLGIKQIQTRLLSSSGVLKNEFSLAMQPDFAELFISETNRGPCSLDEPPKLAVSFGPITVTTCETYRAIIPVGTFTDKEQGNTRNLNLKLAGNSYQWIRFDTRKQELAVLVTDQIASANPTSSVRVTLSATDLNLQSAEQEIVINIVKETKTATHKITMQYSITSLKQDFISLYDVMRQNITKYFSKYSNLLSSVEFNSLPSSLTTGTVMNAEWSSCSLQRATCDQSRINAIINMITPGGGINETFRLALRPYFDVASATVALQGTCKAINAAPFVQNPLPVINISYCGYTEYQVPENTFHDSIDGSTRTMTLIFLNSSNQPATEKWIEFDSKTQKFLILLDDNAVPGKIFPRTFDFVLKATTKRGLSVTDKVRLHLSSIYPNASFLIKVNFAWVAPSPPSRNNILKTIINRFTNYLGGTPNDVHIAELKQEPQSSYPYFVLKIANCTVRYSPCDRETLNAIAPKIHDKHGTVAAFRSAVGAFDIYITYVQIAELGPCLRRNTPPALLNKLSKIQVGTCSDFNYTLPENTFHDEEDRVLQLSVTKVNGMPVSGNYRWLRIVSAGRVLFGVITNRILVEQPTNGYNVTIRATDSGGLFVETSLNVQIFGQLPQDYYQFTLELSALRIGEQFMEEREVIRVLNWYFKKNFTNIMVYTHSPTTNRITIRSSICVLPKKCDEIAAATYFQKIKTTQGSVPAELQAKFSHKYTIISTSVHRAAVCQQPINAPVPSLSTWTIPSTYCGGFRSMVPDSLFQDPEDGNTRNLLLELYIENRKQLPADYWVQLNKTSQTIYGRPTRAIALNYSTSSIMTLVATDKTGQEGSVVVKFSFTHHEEPKYTYKLVYQTSRKYTKAIDEIVDFSQQLQHYLNDYSQSSFGLILHSEPFSGSHSIHYANCSISYNPCDKARLNSAKSLLLTSTNIPTQQFQNAMHGFSIQYGTVQILSPCSESNVHPPSVTSRIALLNITICGLFSFAIPANTFYDTEDGDTRKLSLSLTDASHQALSKNYWLQFNTSTQTIEAFATANHALAQSSSGYSFLLTATDSSSLSASNSFNTKIVGPAQILKDCQIQIVFNVAASLSSSNNNVLIQKVMKGLRTYFSLTATEIGLVDFIRHSSSQFTFSWSYCSASYSHISTSFSSESQVDYHGLVTKILVLMFGADRKSVQAAFLSAFEQLTVVSAKTSFSGVCKNLPPILTSIRKLRIQVENCGYKMEELQQSWFYDYEDGNAFDLNLNLLDNKNKTVSINNWVQIDLKARKVLVSLRDSQRDQLQKDYTFYLKATDKDGKSVFLPITVAKLTPTTTKSPFSITFEFTLPTSYSQNSYVNESIMLSDATAKLYSLINGKSVITSQFTSQAAPVETRSFTWLPCNFQSCSGSSALQLTKQLFDATKSTAQSFKESFLPSFSFRRAYYISSCYTPGLTPAIFGGIIELNISMCSPFKYKLPDSTFVDSSDGEMPNMKIRLLDQNKNPISSSSWIQLNTATLELYAIFQSSALTTSSHIVSSSTASTIPISKIFIFNLEARNSRGVSAYRQLKMNVLDYPYTSDCYATINITRTFGDENTYDLDVLFRLVNAISSFFKEKTTSVKVYKFQKLSAYSYTLVFSNCSFVFSTMKEAKWGLSESHRAAITMIFSQMMQSNGVAANAFATSLASSGFSLTGINTSYSCIESAPFSKVGRLRPYAFLCQTFSDPLSVDLFNDARDGTNLQLSLHYLNGHAVSPNEWVQLDPLNKVIYGAVTQMVKTNIPSFEGYTYILTATDSSGRTANITYNIKIASAAPIQDVRFFLGFESTFTIYSRTTDILLNVTNKIAKYLDNNNHGTNVVIYSYDAISLVSFEMCNFKCTPSMMTTALQKLQKQMFKPVPSDAFKAAMGPDIVPRYIFVNGPKCVETTTVTIHVNHLLISNQPICGFLNYSIPENAFGTSLGETTKDLILTMFTSDNKVIPQDSVIHYHQDLQAIHGVAIFSHLSSSLSYVLTASSSRSTSMVTTNVRLNFPDYVTFRQTEARLCTFSIKLTTNFNPAVSDVFILRTFMKKVATFFKSNVHQIQIVSYSRSITYPISLTIKFSNCSWLYLLQSVATLGMYYQRVETALRLVFQYSGSTLVGTSSIFKSALLPEFTLNSVTINTTTCVAPPDRPPSPKNLNPIEIAPCGEFNYIIPADLFSDEDGNTRSLKVEVLMQDGSQLPTNSWIIFDNVTQTISGLPLNQTLVEQPNGGFKYRIKASDKLGQSTYVTMTIKINGAPYQSYNDIGLHLFYLSTIKSKYEMDHILTFTRKVSRFLGDSKNRVRVMSATVTPTTIAMSLVNCTACDPMNIIKYVVLFVAKGAFNAYMAPEFPMSFSLNPEGRCSPGDDGYNNITNGQTYNVSFCKRNRINFLQQLGVNQLPADTKVIVRNASTGPLPLNSWFWFNESSSVLEAFPSQMTLLNQEANGTYFTWATSSISTDKRSGSFYKDALRIVGSPPLSGLQYTAKFTATSTTSFVDAYYVSLVFDSLSKYFNRNDLQLVSLSRLQTTTLTFEVRFQICGLPADCKDTSVKILDNKIFVSPGNLRPEFKKIFSTGIAIISMSDNCKDQPPEIFMSNLNLTVPICGLFRFKIPQGFAKDPEDGGVENLTIYLRTADNNILPRDSWIRFNSTSREIYALPTESVIRTQPSTGWPFLIVVEDKIGKQAKTSVNIYVKDDQTVYYQLTMSFQTINIDVNLPYLDIQVKFLSLLSAILNDQGLSYYRVLSFSKTVTSGPRSELFFIRFGNCSVSREMCTYSHRSFMASQDQILSGFADTNSIFFKFMASSFKIMSFKNESHYSIDTPPKLISVVNVIRLDSCGMFLDNIPSGTFYDQEQQNNLAFKLTHENRTSPDNNFWMQLVNNKLYVVPNGNEKTGVHRMLITASDKCNNTVSTTVSVDYTSRTEPIQYEIEMRATINSLLPGVIYTSQLKHALKMHFGDSVWNTRFTYYLTDGTNLVMRWVNCSFLCNQTAISNVRNKLFLAYNNINPAFLSLLNFTVINMTDIWSNNCTKPKSTPPVANKSISIQVPLCTKLNFTVPVDTFYDREDGNSRNLQVSLLTQAGDAVSLQSWVQLDQKRQLLYGYPRFTGSLPFQKVYSYRLAATDKHGYSTWTPLVITITDDPPVISYKLTLKGITTVPTSTPLVYQEIRLIEGIGKHFNDYAINDISYSRAGSEYQFSWSFCTMKTDSCDCFRIQKITQALSQIQNLQHQIGPEFTITGEAQQEPHGVCLNTRKPELRRDINEISVSSGQYFVYDIKYDKFYDFEDGYTKNLTLFLSDNNNRKLSDSHWLKIQNFSFCGLLTLSEAHRSGWMKSSSVEYTTYARDSCGMQTGDSFIVRVNTALSYLTYKITIFLKRSPGSNCTRMNTFLQKISTFISTPASFIYVFNYSMYDGPQNSSSVVWGLRNITKTNCNNKTVKQLQEKFLYENGTVKSVFYDHMKPEFEVMLEFLLT